MKKLYSSFNFTAMKKPSLYLINVLVTMLIMPVASIATVVLLIGKPLHWPLIGKWFVFWAIGIRLFIAGLRQIIKPAFTAQEIFHITNQDSLVVVKELGFSNLCMGLAGILSVANPYWTQIIAVCGGLYFGLAGMQHIIKKPVSTNETIALVSDLFIFLLMVAYVAFTWLG